MKCERSQLEAYCGPGCTPRKRRATDHRLRTAQHRRLLPVSCWMQQSLAYSTNRSHDHFVTGDSRLRLSPVPRGSVRPSNPLGRTDLVRAPAPLRRTRRGLPRLLRYPRVISVLPGSVRGVGRKPGPTGRPDRPGWNTGRCPTISRMTVTLLTSQSAPTATDADALHHRCVPGFRTAPFSRSARMKSTFLMAALTPALGATGKPEEITKIPATGRLATPVVVAVGLGPEPRASRRRARGAPGLPGEAAPCPWRRATRDPGLRTGQAHCPRTRPRARKPDEAEAVTLGGLLGGYAFQEVPDRHEARTATSSRSLMYTAHEDAARRARVLADAMTLVRDLVNTSPADMVPADLAAVAEQAAAAHGLSVQVLAENELAKEGYGGILAVGMGSSHAPRLVRLEYTHPDAVRTGGVRGQGHARSTPAASRSSRRRRWRR